MAEQELYFFNETLRKRNHKENVQGYWNYDLKQMRI